MGLIVDTSVFIASERRHESVQELIVRLQQSFGDPDVAFSAITVVELVHGIYRAKTDAIRLQRQAFLDELCRDLTVLPLSLEIARLAGRIDGEQAAKGIAIGFEDLTIGATALHLGFDVCTLNVKHFKLIPGLQIVTLP